jgi:general L-amino acid transport system permease protein
VLPQALRAVIPALVGQFISLFKDTSLVAVIGLVEILGVAEVIRNQPEFLAQGLIAETLLFVSFVYWVGSYSMSRESQRLERRLGVGQR